MSSGRLRRPAVPALAAALAAAMPGAADTLTVEVTDVASSRGVVRVALCTAETFLEPACALAASAAAHAGRTTVVVEAPPGRYGLQAFHDANANHRIDRNVLGMPAEGIGFGNDAPMRFGPPDFADAAVEIGPADGRTSLRMRYLSGR